MKKEINNWSQTNYSNINLTDEQHEANNEWFASQMEITKTGVCVPELGLCWDKETFAQTEMEKYDYVYADMVSRKVMGGE